MNTPAHLILASAAFARPERKGSLSAALVGGMAPDLSLYLMAGAAMHLFGIPASRVFNELYSSSSWQSVFAIDNSFLLWGAVFALATWRNWSWVQVASAAALLHIALDFPLHHDDGRAHFWPLSNWVFQSPVSYWDSDHHANLIAPVSALLAAGCAALVAYRYRSWGPSLLMAVLVASEFYTLRQWLVYF